MKKIIKLVQIIILTLGITFILSCKREKFNYREIFYLINSWANDGEKILFTLKTKSGQFPGLNEVPVYPDFTYTIGIMNSDGTFIKKEIVKGLTPDLSSKDIIAFINDKEEIFKIKTDENTAIKIAEGISPKWSKNGGQILFSNYSGLFIMDPDGSKIIKISEFLDYTSSIEWSPDGEKIIYGLKQNQYIKTPEIYMVNKDGTNNKKIENGSIASWSFDGKSILILGDLEQSINDDNEEIQFYKKMFIVNINGTNKIDLNKDNMLIGNCDWSPDGKKIVFEATWKVKQSQQYQDIYILDSDGTNLKQLTSQGLFGPYSKNPKFSPDGKRIAFEKGHDLFIMNSDGSQQQKITNGFYEEY